MYAFKSNTASSTKTLGEREQSDVHSFPAFSLSDKENKQSLASSGHPPMSQTHHDPLMCLRVTVMYKQPQEFRELKVIKTQTSKEDWKPTALAWPLLSQSWEQMKHKETLPR